MLFNSYTFIFAFLPATLAVYYAFVHTGRFRAAIASVTLASLVFYAWWSPKYMLLLGGLIAFNFAAGKGILRLRERNPKAAFSLLFLSVTVNLGTLGYYKYANFLIGNLNAIFGWEAQLAAIVLPIGISFFTFQEIGLLVDIHQGKVRDFNLIDFALFIMFFPQLIAGPIVHHSEMMPQFARPRRFSTESFSLGVTFFSIGLFKKVILADTAAQFATPQFVAASSGASLDFLAAWSASLAYSAQLYFDFSAYSDMAIGLGQFFNINLPLNFNSPYKASSISDFWRRWHMTLSRFLRDYLYISLGGNRKGKARQYLNLFLTMLLGGIWHGAGWTFVIWGALHGFYLTLNHAWDAAKLRWPILGGSGRVRRTFAGGLTFLAVLIGWVFFRAPDVKTALGVLKGLAGLNGFAMPASWAHWAPGLAVTQSPVNVAWALAVGLSLLTLTWLAPNTQQCLRYSGAVLPGKGASGSSSPSEWRPTLRWALCAGCLFAFSLLMFSQVSEFIYFQF